MHIDAYDAPDAQALLIAGEERLARQRREHRELAIHAGGAVTFLVVAALLAILAPWHRALSLPTLALVVAVWVIVDQVKFPVAGGWTSPTMLAFVPALFLLPTPIVPLVAVAAIQLRGARDVISGRIARSIVVSRFGDAWFTVGPALVIVLGGAARFSWSQWPVYLAALGVQLLFDLSWTVTMVSVAERTKLGVVLPLTSWIYLVDATLAPLGLAIAAVAVPRPGLMLLGLAPLVTLVLLARERQERMDNTLALSTAYRGTAMLLGDVIEDDDEYTGIHSRAVVDLAIGVAHRLNLSATQRRNVEFGALLHDVGKIRVPKEIIHKPGQLDDAEWAIMRQHTVYGEQMLRQVGGTLSSVGKVVRHSHERYDGSGYPDGLIGEEIPIEARIVCACDAYNAMTTNRPYRAAMSRVRANEEMQRCAGSHFDPRVVYALLAEVSEHPPEPVVEVAPLAPPLPAHA